jgi:dTDP-3,4-didehydro-2,6-dideoxy-alpha-D-glucose 3-reductase
MANKKYKIGILGCANIALRSIIPSIKSFDRFILLGIASRDVVKAQSVAKEVGCCIYRDYDELLNDESIEIVYIPLPTGLHYQWIYKALNKGKHVLCEKSLACTYEEVINLTNIAREKQLLLFENFQFRFHSQQVWVKQLLERKELGEIRCFRSSFGFPPFADKGNFRYSKSLGGGSLLDAGAYTLKAMQFILPNCNFTLGSASLYMPSNMEVDLYGGAYFDSAEGVIAELSFGFDNYYQCGYELWGSLGKVTTTRAFTAPANLRPKVIIEKQGYLEEISLQEDDHFANMLAHVADCLDNEDFSNEYVQNLIQSRYIGQIKEYCYGK